MVILPNRRKAFRVSDDYTPPEWTGGNVSTASADSKTLDWQAKIASYGSFAGFSFSHDGKYLLLVSTGDDIYCYTLSIPWDISTATYTSTSTTDYYPSVNQAPMNAKFSLDGTKVIIFKYDGHIERWDLSSAWDLSTRSLNGSGYDAGTQVSQVRAACLSYDGLKFYLGCSSEDKIFQYSMTAAWDLSTAVYDSNSYSHVTYTLNPYGVWISADGEKLFTNAGNIIYQHTLSTPWNISTATYDSNSLSPGYSFRGPAFKDDGTKLYYSYLTDYKIHQFSL